MRCCSWARRCCSSSCSWMRRRCSSCWRSRCVCSTDGPNASKSNGVTEATEEASVAGELFWSGRVSGRKGSNSSSKIGRRVAEGAGRCRGASVTGRRAGSEPVRRCTSASKSTLTFLGDSVAAEEKNKFAGSLEVVRLVVVGSGRAVVGRAAAGRGVLGRDTERGVLGLRSSSTSSTSSELFWRLGSQRLPDS